MLESYLPASKCQSNELLPNFLAVVLTVLMILYYFLFPGWSFKCSRLKRGAGASGPFATSRPVPSSASTWETSTPTRRGTSRAWRPETSISQVHRKPLQGFGEKSYWCPKWFWDMAQNNIPTLLYSPWGKNQCKKSFGSPQFEVHKCVSKS